ncbi:Transcriptional regulator, BadM/Rrf2 family [Candidatus Zixiibacteriota bacterium]|nr:Transcriptional regulator, BadM/Rrf2 family [candidate division Zixibacteria bacterium]
MIYSPTAQHALRALIYLARQTERIPIRVSQIAQAENIPRQFLSKILHNLKNKRLVIATKGPGGGFTLARPAKEISIMDIVEAVDGTQDFDRKCILGLQECNDKAPCALHNHWKSLRDQFSKSIGAMTLDAAVRSLKSK